MSREKQSQEEDTSILEILRSQHYSNILRSVYSGANEARDPFEGVLPQETPSASREFDADELSLASARRDEWLKDVSFVLGFHGLG